MPIRLLRTKDRPAWILILSPAVGAVFIVAEETKHDFSEWLDFGAERNSFSQDGAELRWSVHPVRDSAFLNHVCGSLKF